jgi:hypothetical protein
MPVLAAMREREPRRIGEPIGRPVHDLAHHRERLHSACADTGRQQQFRKIPWPLLCRGGERAVQTAHEHIA